MGAKISALTTADNLGQKQGFSNEDTKSEKIMYLDEFSNTETFKIKTIPAAEPLIWNRTV